MHKANRMPQNATIDQRIKWHIEHLNNCHCRTDIPASVKAAMIERGIPIPEVIE